MLHGSGDSGVCNIIGEKKKLLRQKFPAGGAQVAKYKINVHNDINVILFGRPSPCLVAPFFMCSYWIPDHPPDVKT